MNRERAKELLPIIEAYANGATVEIYAEAVGEWEEIADPSWVTNSAYRIKPEPHDIKWASERSREGVRTRRNRWRAGIYWDGYTLKEAGDPNYTGGRISHNDVLADDWELYEPKGK